MKGVVLGIILIVGVPALFGLLLEEWGMDLFAGQEGAHHDR